MDSLKRVFRPEFINRLDAVIVFRALNRDNIQQIVKLELDKVAVRLQEHEIVLHATPTALNKMGELGYDPDMGARPLRRVIQQYVEDPLSDALLAGEFEDGDTIMVDLAEGEEIVLKKGNHDEPETELEQAAA
jgi:ATP-dependent Clp protease ATP-binding subunit ClpC